MNLSQTAQRAIDASGGSDLWIKHAFIEAEVSLKGLAFRLKHRPFINTQKLTWKLPDYFLFLHQLEKKFWIPPVPHS